MKIENLLEEAELVEGGVTNDVWATDNRIVKRYSRWSPHGILMKSAGFSRIENEDLGPTARIENEKTAEEYFNDKQIQAPEIVYEDYLFAEELGQGFKPGYYAVFEKVDGTSFGESVEELDLDQTYEIARKIGSSLSEMHEEGFARRDSRGENLMYELGKNPDLHWIDNEFFVDKASEFDKNLDISTVVGEAQTYPDLKTDAAIKGLNKGYEQRNIDSSGDFYSKLIALRLTADNPGNRLANYIQNG